MSGEDDVVGGEIETPIILVISGVSNKDSGWTGGPICGQLVGRGWDSKHSRKHASAHMRVRCRKERHTGKRH
jgi:hypothetical protein